jgi:hypothetical protein
MSDSRRIRKALSYWGGIFSRARRETKWLSWGKAMSSVGLIAAREVLAERFGLHPWEAVWETIWLSVVAYLVFAVLQLLGHLTYTPARLHGELQSEGEKAKGREAYLREELDDCLGETARPVASRHLTNAPVVYKIAPAEWLAQNPQVVKELERCRRHVERLRKVLRGVPR